MGEYQISERRIKPDFKEAAAEQEAKLTVLRQRLPEPDRRAYDELLSQQDIALNQLRERHEKLRAPLIEQLYKANERRMMDSGMGLGGDGVDPVAIAHRARAQAVESVENKFSKEHGIAEAKNFQSRDQFFRDTYARLDAKKKTASEKGRTEFNKVSGKEIER